MFFVLKVKITKKALIYAAVGILAFGLLLALLFRISPQLLLEVKNYYVRITMGMSTYLGDFSGGVDQAAINRNINITTVPREYLSSGLFNIIFGKGYGYKQLDVPYLQAFVDLGLIGGIWYFIIAAICPAVSIVHRSDNRAKLLVKYIAIMSIAYNLYSGVPYNHYKFVGLILLAYMDMMNREDRKKTSQFI